MCLNETILYDILFEFDNNINLFSYFTKIKLIKKTTPDFSTRISASLITPRSKAEFFPDKYLNL